MQQVKYSAAFNQHKRLSEQSHDEISKAMDLDEQNIERDKVIALYRMGINTMKSALKIQITSATERMIVDPTNVKLHRNIKATEERVSHLLSLDPQVSNVKRPTAKPVYRPTPRISRPTSAPKSNPTGGEKVDAELCKRILDDVLIKNTGVGWNDIVGLETAKDSLKEIVVYPRLRPELFTGLRSPAKGVLLFGPPGNLI